jgi:cellulose synthase operon protein YhjU
MGAWTGFFVAGVYLHLRGLLRLEPLPLVGLALLVAVPLPRAVAGHRAARAARHVLAAAAAAAILWRASFLPSPARALRLLGDTGGHLSPAYVLRLVAGGLPWLDVLAVAALLAACVLLARRIFVAPFTLAAIGAVALLGPGRGSADHAAELERFWAAEAARTVRFPERPAGEDLDVVLLHVCSMSWDDLRASGLDRHPFLRQLDLVLTGFNSVSSYTNPSAIRLLRAACGQPRHGELYREARPECYLLDALRRAGYRTWSAVDNDAPSYRFVEDVRAFGHADPPLPLDGVAVRQVDFDGTPIHDDRAVLERWLEARRASGARRAALYADLTTLHGGAHPAGEERWWLRSRPELYREAGERLFANLDGFLEALRASGRTTLVVLVAEHGMALAGSTLQPPDLREIPLPEITTVPAALKLVGPGLPRVPDRPVTVAGPTSYLALAHLVAAALDAPRAALPTSPAELARIPRTRFVAENEAAQVIRAGDEVLWRKRDAPFAPVPAARATAPR